jgi:hypothetical protein
MRKTILLLLACLLIATVSAKAHGNAQAGPLQATPTEILSPYPVPEPTQTGTAAPAPTELPVNTATSAPGFYVSRVEPARISPITGGTLSIYGGGFVTGTAVRLVGFGLLDAVVINATAIKAVVPPGVPPKLYSIQVILPDGTTYRVNDALRVREPKEEPTATPKPGRTLIFGRPQLVIESAASVPATIRPGESFTLTLQLLNLGDLTATNVRITLASPELAIPRGSSSLTVVDLIANQQQQDVSLPLVLNKTAVSGYQNLQLSLEYSDYTGKSYQSQQTVGLDVSSSLADQPLVLLSGYATEPESLSPGEAFTLDLEITNAGEGDAYQLLVTLGGEAGSQPFAILGAGNVKLVALLGPGESVQLSHRLILDGAAEAGVYNLPVTLAYENAAGERSSESQALNLLVNRRPQMQVSFYQDVALGQIGQPLALPIELVNIGRSSINVSTMAVSGEGLEVTTGSWFVGVLDGGTTASLDAEVIPQKPGTLPVQIAIHYLDDFNQPQVITHTLSVEVEDTATPPPLAPGQSPGEAQGETGLLGRIWAFLRALLGLGS